MPASRKAKKAKTPPVAAMLAASTLPTLLRVDEAAKILNLRPKTLRNKISSREISVVRLGRSVRISAESIQEMIDRGSEPARIA